MPKKSKTASPFARRWRITSMETWDQDYVDEEVEGFFEFGPKGDGRFQFGYVCGMIDYRPGIRDGKPCLEWTWDGNDEMTPVSGRGWAVIEGDELHGLIAIHNGDDSSFVAKKADKPRSKSKKPKAS